MVYDCFTFFNEFDLLEIRLNELRHVVDKFIICESDLTHTGKKKPLNFPEVAERYAGFDIEYLVYRGIPEVSDAWINEESQRNFLAKGLLGCSRGDIVVLSDIDELPNPSTVAGFDEPCICSLQMNVGYFYMNCMFDNLWSHPKIFKYGNIAAGTLSDIRLRRGSFLTKAIPNGGTHFSYLGGVEKIRYKLNSFAHQEFNTDTINNEELLRWRIDRNEDLFGLGKKLKKFRLDEIDYYFPEYVLENRAKFAHLIRS